MSAMHVASFVCKLCDCSFNCQELLMAHNRFHVKKENVSSVPDDFDLSTSETSNEFSTRNTTNQSTVQVKRECNFTEIGGKEPESNVKRLALNDAHDQNSLGVSFDQPSLPLTGKTSKTFVCTKCYLKCESEEALASHYELHIKYGVQSTLFDSFGSYSKTQPYLRCNICNLLFSCKGEFRDHFKRAHCSKFSCCGVCFPKLRNLCRHIKSSHKDQLVYCDKCTKGFVKTKDLQGHYKTHIGESSRGWYTTDEKPTTVVKKDPGM